MEITVFRDEHGKTIPIDFMMELDPLPQGFYIEDYHQKQITYFFRKLTHIKLRCKITKKNIHMQENAIFFCVIQFLYLTLGQKNAMIYGYIRVSSDKQTVENQRFEIQNFCNTKGVHIDDWIEETISGTKNYTKRQLGHLLQNANKGAIVFEFSILLLF